jgi:hypothetical protein
MEERAWGGNSAKAAPLKHHGQENVPETWAIANMIIHGLGWETWSRPQQRSKIQDTATGRVDSTPTGTSLPIHCGANMVYLSQPEIKYRSPFASQKTLRPAFLYLTN